MYSQTSRYVVAATMVATALCLTSAARPRVATFAPPHAQPAFAGSRSVRAFELHQRALRDSIVRAALAQVGTPYRLGGATPDSFDCSGLVRYVYSRHYVTPPRLAGHQAHIGAPIRRNELLPGDVLTFGVGDSVTHVGIYVGNRKFVHASSIAGRVIVSAVDRAPSELIRPLKGARRVLSSPGRARVFATF